jgi:hypothetical protein
MIKHDIRVRGRHQIEIVLAYPLAQEQKTSHCSVETYVFVPLALGIDRGTYTKDDFYRDLQVFSRLKTPTVPLSEIANSDSGPLLRIAQACQARDGRLDAATFERETKLFCCVLRSALRDSVNAAAQGSDTEIRNQPFAEYVGNVVAIAHGYRRLRPLAQEASTTLLEVYELGDEYVSLVMEEFSFGLLEAIGKDTEEVSPEARRKLLEFISTEVSYRAQRGYPSVPERDGDNEIVLYRRGLLKKFAHSVLYMRTQQSAEGRLLEQAVFGFSAGVAMLLATGIAFASTAVYGAISVPVFTALVVGYIFKDRLKELLRIYLSRKLGSRIFDHATRIRTHADRKIGVFKEGFEFIDERKLPREVLRIRNGGRQFHVDNLEFGGSADKVMLFRRRFKFSSKAIARVFEGHDLRGVNDIMRLSILEMARKAGHPRKPLYMVDRDGYSRVRGERVHHLNLVVHLSLNDESTYTHFRVVFNSRKIKRIDEIPVDQGLAD